MEKTFVETDKLVANLANMVRGWFVGNFSPAVFQTETFEAAVQKYKAGDIEPNHVHKVATEITVIVTGEAKMNGVIYTEGDIIVTKPGNSSDFIAVTDVITTVIKIPSVPNDKYLVT